MSPDPQREAQARADQIRAFRRELSALAAAGVLRLSADQEAELGRYHSELLGSLASDFDVDRSEREGQLSRGLRLASLFGAATLLAAITALVHRMWGGLALPTQVTLLTAFPLAALAGVHVAAERERTRYVAGLFALVACGTAWFAIGMIARLLDLPFSELLLWPAAAFGIAVSVSYGFRLVFALSLAVLAVAMSSVFFAAAGVPWPTLVERLEPFTGSTVVLLALSRQAEHVYPGFGSAARHTGLVLTLGALLLLSNARGFSLFAFDPSTSLALYQVIFLIVAPALLWRALRRGDRPGVTIVAVMLALFFLVRYVDWFWDLLPAWAFFLVMAAAAFGSIWLLRRVRRHARAA
jgi:hypothetical protein